MKRIWVLIKNALAWLWSYIKKGLEWIWGWIKKGYEWVLTRSQIYFCIIILAILITAFAGNILHITWPPVLAVTAGVIVGVVRVIRTGEPNWKKFVCWIIGGLLMWLIYLIP